MRAIGDHAIVLNECACAVDHLRDALDALPPTSPQAHALLGVLRRLVDFVDSVGEPKAFGR